MKHKMAKKYTVEFIDFMEKKKDFRDYTIDLENSKDFYFDSKIVDYIGEMQYI